MQELQDILDYLEENTVGQDNVYVSSFSVQFQRNGYLSVRQMDTLESIIRSHLEMVERIYSFHESLKDLLKTEGAQMTLKLAV